MIKSLEASMLNLPYSVEVLAPLCAQHGIEAIGCTRDILGDEKRAKEVGAMVKDLGLKWGLMPMPADFYHWDLDEEAFEQALVTLAKEAGSTKAVNVVLLGRLSHYFDLDEAVWQEALTALVPPKFLELNKKAFALGANPQQ